MHHSREYYLIQLGRLLMMLLGTFFLTIFLTFLGLLITYYWCQIFIFLYFRYGTRQLYQVLFSYVFPFSIMGKKKLAVII